MRGDNFRRHIRHVLKLAGPSTEPCLSVSPSFPNVHQSSCTPLHVSQKTGPQLLKGKDIAVICSSSSSKQKPTRKGIISSTHLHYHGHWSIIIIIIKDDWCWEQSNPTLSSPLKVSLIHSSIIGKRIQNALSSRVKARIFCRSKKQK